VAPYRCDDAEAILVAMGTMADTAISVVDHLRSRAAASAS
jgi:pyruvate/2-oxoacid:ferredoxin oxidoreductase alpha subunit